MASDNVSRAFLRKRTLPPPINPEDAPSTFSSQEGLCRKESSDAEGVTQDASGVPRSEPDLIRILTRILTTQNWTLNLTLPNGRTWLKRVQ